MSRRNAIAGWGLLIAICLSELPAWPAGAAQKLDFRKTLGTDEAECLAELIHVSGWSKYTPQFASEMMRTAQVARTNLSGANRPAYFYLFEDSGWCGTAGCAMLIGEREGNGQCRLLYDGNGFDNVLVLRRRDYGHRRLYLPCEARFNGRHYHQLHAECPTLGVER